MKRGLNIALLIAVALVFAVPSVFAGDDDDSSKDLDSLLEDVLKDADANGVLMDKADSLRFKVPHPTAKDTAEFVGIYRQLADKLPWAAYQMGEVYLFGWSVPPDSIEAVKWYAKSAEMGDNRGMRSIGIAKLYGVGTPVDTNGGLTWLAKASDNGNMEAAAYLGELYFYGKQYVPQIDSLAVLHLARAYNNGDLKSAEHLCDIYFDDQSRYYNDSVAFEFAKYLDSKGIAKYESRTGMMYLMGYGISPDPYAAGTHLYTAAIQNNRDAEAYLAFMYYAAMGTKTNYVQSYAWAQRAVGHGETELAPQLIDSLNLVITPAQKDSAATITPDWLPFTEADARYEEVKKKREEQIKAGKVRPGSSGSSRGQTAQSADTTKTDNTATTRPARGASSGRRPR